LLRHVRLEPTRSARPLSPRRAGAGRLRLRLSLRAAAGVAADIAQDGAVERFVGRAGAGRTGRERTPHRRRRAAARAFGAKGNGHLVAADELRPDPSIPLDGDAAPVDAAA